MAVGAASRAALAERELPSRLRRAREAKGLSTRALAERVGVSPSLISQIELGKSNPSVGTLYAIAAELETSIDALIFDRAPESRRAGPVARPADRPEILMHSGVTWERLTATSQLGVDFLLITYPPGSSSSDGPTLARHAGHEWGYVLEGELKVTIGFDSHDLRAGDALSFDSTTPHRFENVSDQPARAVWFTLGRAGSPGA